jgi:hypothetical protein
MLRGSRRTNVTPEVSRSPPAPAYFTLRVDARPVKLYYAHLRCGLYLYAERLP